MENDQYRNVMVGAGIAALVMAVLSGRLPRWLRITLVIGILVLACGAGLFSYRYINEPTTLTVAVGSFDGEALQLTSKLATRLASTGADVRLKVIDKGDSLSAAKAFSDGQAQLAIVRADVGDLSSAGVVAVVTRSVALIVAPPGSSITDMDDLKGKTIGVLGGEVNQRVVQSLTKEYGLDNAKTTFKNLKLAEVPAAIKAKQISALLVVMPLSERYLAALRGLFPKAGKQQLTLVPIEAAGAIATVTRYYQSYDLPKGTIQGSPAIPDDDMKTLHVPFYLVAKKTLSDTVVGALAKAIMDARRDLIGEYPLAAQISEPNTDKTDDDNDTYIPVHPGAAAYFGGTEQSFFDKYSNQLFYGPMVLATLGSLLAAAWKFMSTNQESPGDRPLLRLHALASRITKSGKEDELTEIERQIDEILQRELEGYSSGSPATDAAVLGVATNRLQHLIAQQRVKLGGASRMNAAGAGVTI